MPQDGGVHRSTPEEAAAVMAAWNECGDAREFACRVLAAVMNAMTGREAQEACGVGSAAGVARRLLYHGYARHLVPRMWGVH